MINTREDTLAIEYCLPLSMTTHPKLQQNLLYFQAMKTTIVINYHSIYVYIYIYISIYM